MGRVASHPKRDAPLQTCKPKVRKCRPDQTTPRRARSSTEDYVLTEARWPHNEAICSLAMCNAAPVSCHPKLHDVLMTENGFVDIHRHFILGRNFADGFQSSMQMLFAYDPCRLGLAYSAYLELCSYSNCETRVLDGLGLTFGSNCLELFWKDQSPITGVKDAAVMLMMGQAMLIYTAFLPGLPSRIIMRAALLRVRDWIPALVQQPELDCATLGSVFTDTVESLIRREPPACRLPNTNRLIVDRFIGLCSALQPLLYDLAEHSYRIKAYRPSTADWLVNNDLYSEVESKINTWSAVCPPDFFDRFEALETAAMLAQSRLYRSAALLIAHRLRYPLGTEDDVGRRHANDIFHELLAIGKWPIDARIGLGLNFPLLVALLELPIQTGEESTKAFQSRMFQRQGSEDILKFVKSVKSAYKNGFNGLWSDLVKDELPNVLFP